MDRDTPEERTQKRLIRDGKLKPGETLELEPRKDGRGFNVFAIPQDVATGRIEAV